jgi:hypothetical protein
MLSMLLLTGQGAAFAAIWNMVLFAVGAAALMIGLVAGERYVPAKELRVSCALFASAALAFSIVRLRSGRAYELKYSGMNGPVLTDWVSVVLVGSTQRADQGIIGAGNVWLLPWALVVVCLAIGHRAQRQK